MVEHIFLLYIGISLQNNIIAYLQEQNVDQFAVDNALSILQLYHQTNEVFNFSDVDYVDISLFEHKKLKCLVPYDLDIRKNFTVEECKNIFNSRHSIRLYDEDGGEVENQVLYTRARSHNIQHSWNIDNKKQHLNK